MENKLAESAFNLHQQIKELRFKVENMVRICTIELGRLLKKMRDEKLYESLGHKTFLSYLGDPEISFSQATAYNAIRIYETYILNLATPPEALEGIPVRRLVYLLPVVNKKTVLEWLDKARSLSESDFRTEIGEDRINENQEKYLPYPKITRCPKCGKFRIDVPEENLCTCP